MPDDAEFLLCHFRRRLKWEEAEDGRIVVLRPRLGEGRIGRWLESLLGFSFSLFFSGTGYRFTICIIFIFLRVLT